MAANPRSHIHFTPTSASWPNLVEIWFGIIERQAFAPVRELMIKIRTFINGWNDRCHPFIWTKTADQIFKKANRQQLKLRSTSDAEYLFSWRLPHCYGPPHSMSNRAAGFDSSGFFCSFGKRDLLAAFKEEPHKRQKHHKF
jgi:hypothetical protein